MVILLWKYSSNGLYCPCRILFSKCLRILTSLMTPQTSLLTTLNVLSVISLAIGDPLAGGSIENQRTHTGRRYSDMTSSSELIHQLVLLFYTESTAPCTPSIPWTCTVPVLWKPVLAQWRVPQNCTSPSAPSPIFWGACPRNPCFSAATQHQPSYIAPSLSAQRLGNSYTDVLTPPTSQAERGATGTSMS